MFGSVACGTCQQVKELTGPVNLALLGVAFYLVLFVLTLVERLTLQVRGSIFVAAGVHLALLGILISQRTWCLPCITTALIALAMSIWLLSTFPRLLVPGILLITTGSVAGSVGLSIEARTFAAHRQRAAQIAAVEVARAHAPPSVGQTTLVILTRSGCSHCAELKAGPLPDVEQVFGGMLNVEEQNAPAEVPTPTLVVLGRSNYFMAGVPTKEQLATLIRLADSAEIPESLPAGIMFLHLGPATQPVN